jgi:nickel transport protein
LGHKVFVFGSVRGQLIAGEAYYLGGDPAAGVRITVLDPAGKMLGETTTDEEGDFTFQPRVRCDHRLVADAGMGHQAEHTIEAAELPAELPGGASGDAPHPSAPLPSAGSVGEHQHAHGLPGDDLAVQTEALSQQLTALRKDLDKWRAELRLQDILGGVGYILGLAGLAFYFLGVRRKENRMETEP